VSCKKCDLSQYGKECQGRGDMGIATIVSIGDFPSVSDAMLGRSFTGKPGSLLVSLFERAKISPDRVYFMHAVRCRPKEDDPTHAQYVICYQNTTEILHKIFPAAVVLIGDMVKKLYYTHLKDHYHVCCISHPDILLMGGGVSSPLFRDNINKLEAMKNAAL